MVLAERGPDRFAAIAAELKALWLERMQALLEWLPQRRVLLWMADHAPEPAGQGAGLSSSPWLVDRSMVNALRPLASACVEVLTSAAARAEGVRAMRFR
jgi:hypothetical protein